MRRALLVVALICIPSLVQAQDAPAAKVDQYVRAQMEKGHIPGLSIAVVRNGQTVLARGYGYANVELSVPASADSVYELLSVGKQFTAAATLLLVEQSKLALDEKISQHLDDLPAAWNDVTVRQLLWHTSGIPDYTDVPGFVQHLRDDATPLEQIAPLKSRPLQFAPGTRWRYSNTNYYLLGLIIERISGETFDRFLATQVFQPLAMNATRLNDMADMIPHRAAGYSFRHDRLQNAGYVSPTKKWAAGGVVSSANDLVKWEQALVSGKLLKSETIAMMTQPAKLAGGATADYGFGNELGEIKGHRIAGHQGGGLAFNCAIYRLVDDKLSVIVLCNQTSAPSRAIAAHIAAIYLPELADDENRGIEDAEPHVAALLKTILANAAQGQADESQFAPGSKELADFVRKTGPGFLRRLGAPTALVLLDRRGAAGDARRVSHYRVTFEKGEMIWTITLDPAGKILSLEPTEP